MNPLYFIYNYVVKIDKLPRQNDETPEINLTPYEFYATLENGEEFGLVFLAYYDPCDFEPGTEIDGKYWVFKPVRSESRMCRGSLDWFYTLYEKYSS